MRLKTQHPNLQGLNSCKFLFPRNSRDLQGFKTCQLGWWVFNLEIEYLSWSLWPICNSSSLISHWTFSSSKSLGKLLILHHFKEHTSDSPLMLVSKHKYCIDRHKLKDNSYSRYIPETGTEQFMLYCFTLLKIYVYVHIYDIYIHRQILLITQSQNTRKKWSTYTSILFVLWISKICGIFNPLHNSI